MAGLIAMAQHEDKLAGLMVRLRTHTADVEAEGPAWWKTEPINGLKPEGLKPEGHTPKPASERLSRGTSDPAPVGSGAGTLSLAE